MQAEARPITCAIPTLALGIWRALARSSWVRCHTTSQILATPVAPIGCPLDSRHETNEKIDDLELFGMVMVLVTGRIGTTSDLISGSIYQMLRRPALYEAIKRNRSLVSVLLEETLRYDGPIHTLFRVTTTDVEVGGLHIPVRTPVCVVNGAADRDPRKFPHPDEFDITRDLNDHIGFGEGIHFCVGAAPARVEARVALERILERFPWMRLADGFEPAYNNAFDRGLATLPVRLD